MRTRFGGRPQFQPRGSDVGCSYLPGGRKGKNKKADQENLNIKTFGKITGPGDFGPIRLLNMLAGLHAI